MPASEGSPRADRQPGRSSGLYLHSGLVQTRGYGDGLEEKHEAIKLATIDSSIALCLALVINASILILAAATFHRVTTDLANPR